jgi:hypothetical protein
MRYMNKYLIDVVNFLFICLPIVFSFITPDHLLLDSGPNLGPLTSHWEINYFENC